ncbi:MAG TPA: Type 1 glutamine amidotransferase-like domain-containing protein [Acidimicrobiales bacterium]|nr:Type 1 glutamine amidotransferase-like domain-containing protein [Acidimicrobiales bacterium]
MASSAAASAGPSAGPLALVGSGEYLTQMMDIEGALISGRPPRYVQLATAAVPDGAAVVEKWHRLGREQAERLGVEAVILDVQSREDADSPEIASQIAGAGLIYLSGGHPDFLADTLRSSPVWAAIVEAWQSGSALAGCSAGAMAMAASVPSLRHPREGGTAGLALLPHLRVIPHFDAFISRVPGFLAKFLTPLDPHVTVVGIDEKTALVGGPTEWTVQGRSSVWRLTGSAREELPVGTTVVTPTLPT